MVKGFKKDGIFRPTVNRGSSSKEKSIETSGMKMKNKKESVRVSNSNRDNSFFSDHAFVLTLKNDTTDEDIPIEIETEDNGFKIITEFEELFFDMNGVKVDSLDDENDDDDNDDDDDQGGLRISNSRADNRFFSDHAFVLTMKNDSTEEDVNVEFEVEDKGFKIITENEELLFKFNGERVDFFEDDE